VICVNGGVIDRKEVMEIPNHQRQLEERSAEEITGDQYAIFFFFIFVASCNYNDVNIDIAGRHCSCLFAVVCSRMHVLTCSDFRELIYDKIQH